MKAPWTPGEGLLHAFLEDSVHLVGVAVLTAGHPGPQLSSLPFRFLLLFLKFTGVTAVRKVAQFQVYTFITRRLGSAPCATTQSSVSSRRRV